MSVFGQCPVCEKWVLAVGEDASISVVLHTTVPAGRCPGSGCRPTHKSPPFGGPPTRYLGLGMWRFDHGTYPRGVPLGRLDGGDPARSKAEPERPLLSEGVMP